jgi:serine/threonine protein kinase
MLVQGGIPQYAPVYPQYYPQQPYAPQYYAQNRPSYPPPPQQRQAPPPALRQFARFQLNPADFTKDAPLGKGTFGSVFHATHRPTLIPVAIKELHCVLPAKQREYFEREVEILIRANGPFLLQMHGFTLEPSFSIVTEYVQGGSLWDFLRTNPRRLTPLQRTAIAYGIAHGMRSLHGYGVLHRDLKSSNILLAPGNLVRIADFGLGKSVEGAQQTITRAAGTAQWMAPEQIFTKNYGFPVDVYAFGTVLFELLTEQIPFHGLPQAEIYKILEAGKRPVIPVELASTDLYWVIYRCWEQDPTRRPTFEQICEEFETELLGFPGTNPGDLRPLRHYARKRDGSWIWSARAFGVELLSSPLDSSVDRVFAAAANGEIQEFVEAFMLGDMDVNVKDASGRTPLLLAILNGRPLMVTFLLGITGIDPNSLSPDGNPPIIVAVLSRQLDCLDALLACEAVDVNRKNERGDALVHVLLMVRRREYWHALSKAGRKPELTLKNKEGKTPKQIATEIGWTDVATRLPEG